MRIAQNLKYVLPAGTRTIIKQRYPHLIERLAIAIDNIPIVLNVRRWPLLLNPRPLRHPLTSKMWSGFGDQVAKELERIKLLTQSHSKIRASAAWSLAQWYSDKGNHAAALDNLLLMTTAVPRLRRSSYTHLMVVECLLQLGRPEDAKRWFEWASEGVNNLRTETFLSAANIYHALAGRSEPDPTFDDRRLMWINKAYENAGFAKIEKRDKSAPLTLDNLTVRDPRSVEASAKLSVLMPAYNCAKTLPIALTSVLGQTWDNLEVLVVDDSSQDETWAIIQRFAREDPRIVPIRHERNGGAYTARNTALAHATGEFVTVHDADDWSHPEKFAAQMAYASSQPDGISTTVGVRVSSDLRFGVKPNTGGMIMENTSSLLVKRTILTELGGWDRTRVAADSELYERVKAKFGLVTNKLFPTTPLTLILFSGSSLTQTTAAGIDTVNYGARRQYKEAYRFWHAMELAKPEPDLRMQSDRRFPAPRILLRRNEPITDVDVLFVGNFAGAGTSSQASVLRWKALAEANLKLAIAHWPTYRHAEANIAPAIRSAIMTGLVENIVPGEEVSCKLAVVYDPQLLKAAPSPLPTIRPGKLFVATENGLSGDQKEAMTRFFGVQPHPIGEDYLETILSTAEDARQRQHTR